MCGFYRNLRNEILKRRYTETYADLINNYPDLVFVRTKKFVSSASEIDDNLVLEDDTLPLIRGKSFVIPIDETAYPKILKEATATIAGMYALYLCEKNGWDVSPQMVWYVLEKQENCM